MIYICDKLYQFLIQNSPIAILNDRIACPEFTSGVNADDNMFSPTFLDYYILRIGIKYKINFTCSIKY